MCKHCKCNQCSNYKVKQELTIFDKLMGELLTKCQEPNNDEARVNLGLYLNWRNANKNHEIIKKTEKTLIPEFAQESDLFYTLDTKELILGRGSSEPVKVIAIDSKFLRG